MTLHKIFVDFNNADSFGRIRLNTKGSIDDIEKTKIKLEAGIEVLLDDDDSLSIIGTIEFSDQEHIWVAKIDWDKLNSIHKNSAS